MDTKLRPSGIEGLGDMPWGTHFCLFYETKEDLLDILIPYFRTGLENHESCLWVTPEPLSPEEAKRTMREAGLEFERHLADEQIEIVSYTDWYLAGGRFDIQRVLEDWIDKHDQAIAKGYAGLRCTGNTFWLEKHQWDSFANYEVEIDEIVSKLQIIVLCTYPLESRSAKDVLDVVHQHQFTVAKRNGTWEHLEGSKLKRAHDEIRQLNEDLERRVVERTAQLAATNEQLKLEIIERKQAEEEREHLFEELHQSNEQSKVLSRRLVEVQESERKRLAREIHDDISQTLTASIMQLGTAKSLLPKSAKSAHTILEQTEELIKNTLEQTRLIIADLRPPVLDDLGLVPALRRLGDELQGSTGATIKIKTSRLPQRLPAPIEVALFRIVQEALANIRRHAQAHHVTISLAKESERVILSVQDDGIGFEKQTSQSRQRGDMVIEQGLVIPAGHFGLIGIQERVTQLGGKFDVTSAPGQGTTLRVELPL